jgi:hypothetical protein
MRHFWNLTCMLALSGCASIAGSPSQVIQITAVDEEGHRLENSLCILVNSYGRWSVMAPGTVVVGRSNEHLNVNCTRADGYVGSTRIGSTVRPVAYGNILVGGFVGAAVDHISGSAYGFPDEVKIIMLRSK